MRKNCLIILFLLCAGGYAVQNVDISGHMHGGATDANSTSIDEWAQEVILRYSGNIPLTEKAGFLISEEFDGISSPTNVSPLRAVNHPIVSRTAVGLEFTRVGRMQITGLSQIFYKSTNTDIAVPNDLNTPLKQATMIQRSRSSADFFWEIPIQSLTVSANAFYTYLSYDYYRMGDVKNDQHDADIWVDGALSYSFRKDKLRLKARTVVKHDLNESADYNLVQAFFGIEGDFMLMKRKIKGTVDFFPRYYFSPVMEDKNYADEIGVVSNLRLFYQIVPRFFIKTDLEYEVAPHTSSAWYIKQRYDLALRKTGKNFSAVEAGGWGTFGSLFPRICGYANAEIAVVPKLDILPAVKAFFTLGNTTTKVPDSANVVNGAIVLSGDEYTFYRTDLQLGIRYKPGVERSVFLRNTAVTCGAVYKLFNWGTTVNGETPKDAPYVNNLHLFLGFTNYL